MFFIFLLFFYFTHFSLSLGKRWCFGINIRVLWFFLYYIPLFLSASLTERSSVLQGTLQVCVHFIFHFFRSRAFPFVFVFRSWCIFYYIGNSKANTATIFFLSFHFYSSTVFYQSREEKASERNCSGASRGFFFIFFYLHKTSRINSPPSFFSLVFLHKYGDWILNTLEENKKEGKALVSGGASKLKIN